LLRGTAVTVIKTSLRAAARQSSEPVRQAENQARKCGIVPLGVLLTQVQLQVSDPPGVPLTPGRRRRAQRVADPFDDLFSGTRDDGPHP